MLKNLRNSADFCPTNHVVDFVSSCKHRPLPLILFHFQSITMFEDIEFTTERILMWSVTFVVFVVVTYLTVADLTAPDNLDRGLRPVRTTKKSGKKED